ncbi:hypothetical protein EOA46_34020, partial [Mesorhizobium sp. M1A.F.Ca.IN.022.05.2.1]|uniref:hypothetical protein n=1 Tax=Mesorhizobium sp. M1A.F.Ca.IN.022.05.2.1 TaxID=2496760 RepID=UPI000FD1A72F
ITNLLASEAQFSDVIHPDLYSDAHVIPVGTADPIRAMRAADRRPEQISPAKPSDLSLGLTDDGQASSSATIGAACPAAFRRKLLV